MSDFVVADVVVVMTGLSSLWRTRKTRTMNIRAVVVAVDVTTMKTTTMAMITAK